MCYNLLIDAYGQKSLYKKAEETYVDLLQARCIPTEDTYALLIKAYCACGLLEKAEAAFVDMRKYSLPPSMCLSIHFFLAFREIVFQEVIRSTISYTTKISSTFKILFLNLFFCGVKFVLNFETLLNNCTELYLFFLFGGEVY